MATKQQKLDKEFPPRTKVKPFTKADYKTYETFRNERTLNISNNQSHVNLVCEIFHRTFKWKKEKGKVIELGNVWYPETPGTSASIKVLHGMIKKLDIVFKHSK